MALADVILSARLSVGDGPTDNLARNENLDNNDIGNVVNGTNKTFAVINYPVVSSGVQSCYVDGASITPYGAGWSAYNEAIGEYTFTVAPTQSAFITYYYYLMPDSTWQEFVVTGMEKLNLSTGAANIATDLTALPVGLTPALKLYACAGWCMRISSQTGLWYNQKLQERDEDRDSISTKFVRLAQEWNKQGDAARDSFYSGAGTQKRPAFTIIEHSPKPITPYR